MGYKRSSIPYWLMIAAFALVSMTRVASAQSVTLDGQPVSGVAMHNGVLLVPFRAPMESVGATVDWNNPTATASLHGQQLVTVTVGSRNEVVKGTTHTLPVAPQLVHNLSYVPVDALAAICGARVVYSSDRRSATVTNCNLVGINRVAAAAPVALPTAVPVPLAAAPPPAPSFNWLPWLIGLLILGALALWLLNRQRTVYSTNVTSPMRDDTTVQSATTATTTTDNYAMRLRNALAGMDDQQRGAFVQQLKQTITDNRELAPAGFLQSAKSALDASANGSSGAVGSLINLLRDYPQLLQVAVRKFAATNPGALSSMI